MRILNLYAGVGGNRKLWGSEHQVTSVESNPEIADMYKSFYPQDILIVEDAHQYLLNHYTEYDFIWSSPPCPSHSRSRFWGMNRGYDPVYPDMKLYEEILLLTHYFKGKWCVENVIPFYAPLIPPQKVGRHLYWANFPVPTVASKSLSHIQNSLSLLEEYFGFTISDKKYSGDKRVILRNCVEPDIGKAILDASISQAQEPLF